MNLATGPRVSADPAKRWVANIRCPFCNAHKVEISEVTGCSLGDVRRGVGDDGGGPGQGLIYSFAAHCENCQRTYRQTYPASLMPLDFALPV